MGGPCIIYTLFLFLQRYKNYFKYANILSIIFKIVRPHIEALIPYRVGARDPKGLIIFLRSGAGELYSILKYCLSGQMSK